MNTDTAAHQFKVGDKVQFTISRETSRGGYNFKSRSGVITSMIKGDSVAIKAGRGTFYRGVGEIALEGQPSGLTQMLYAMAGKPLPTALLLLTLLLVGCRDEQPTALNAAQLAESNHLFALAKVAAEIGAKQNREITYLDGWNHGFSIASGIHNARFKSPQEANIEADTLRSNYLATPIR